MTDETNEKNDHQKCIDTLISRAAKTEDPNDAMKFSQAALNVANAIITMNTTPATAKT